MLALTPPPNIQGQVLIGTWVEGTHKCGEMHDLQREDAENPTPYPIPQVRAKGCSVHPCLLCHSISLPFVSFFIGFSHQLGLKEPEAVLEAAARAHMATAEFESAAV